MKCTFHRLAIDELNNAINFYEARQDGLGLEFAEEVDSTIQRIFQYPLANSQISKNCRKCLTHRFPYGIIYQMLEEDILIVSIMHLNREPEYWHNRV